MQDRFPSARATSNEKGALQRGSPPVQIAVGIFSIIIGVLLPFSDHIAGYVLVILGIAVATIGVLRLSRIS